jgi:predicted metal-binding protein
MTAETFVANVTRYLDGLEPVFAGAACGCEACGLGDLAHPDDDQSRFEAAETLGMSWYRCEVCGGDPGERHAAHGWLKTDEGEELVHLTVCTDCLVFVANGDLPDDQ